MWLGETAHYAAQTVHSKHFLYVLFWSNIISFWYTDFTKIILRLNPIRHETLCHSPFLEPRGLCFTCGFQCSAFERWQLTGRKWEVSAEGQTKQSKGCFSERAEGKHSKGKGCGRVKHSSRCTDGLRIFIKLTRHHVRRALPEKKKKKKVFPDGLSHPLRFLCWLCNSVAAPVNYTAWCVLVAMRLLKVNPTGVMWRALYSQQPL